MDNDGIFPATAADIETVSRNMRPEHGREISLMFFRDPGTALNQGVETAAVCLAGRKNGMALFVAGVAHPSPLTNAALGWLIGTPEMDNHGVWIAERSREWLSSLHRLSGARRIENWIPADYREAWKWLAWLGFDEGGPEVEKNGVLHIHMWHDAEVEP